jgi:outer membrane protein assembly factor BamA
MKKKFYHLLLMLFLVSNQNYLRAQAIADSSEKNNTETIIVSAIKINGNKQTKDYLILREMPFKIGDTLPKAALQNLFNRAKTQVYNTNLFIEVKIDSILLADTSLQVNVVVKERWYIFPTPQVAFIDGINAWYKTYNADFKRVIYGIDFTHYNFSGRRDEFSVTLLNGYARNISVSYRAPYSNSKLTEGFGIGAGFTQNRGIGFKTNFNNRILFYGQDDFVRSNFNIAASYSRRKNFFKRTSFSLNLQYTNVADSIIIKNPNYFNSNKAYQFYPTLGVGISYANTDKNNYPLKGLTYNYGISKTGTGFNGGINVTTAYGSFAKYFTHKYHFYSSISASAILKIPFEQAYINQRAIGNGNLRLRGLELYIVDGVAAAVTNFTFSKKLVGFNIPFPFGIKAIPYIPVNIFAKTYADVGYSYIPQPYVGKLNNKFLYTGGVGVDVLTLYDIVLKVEYSLNQLGEKGLFLHGSGGF